MKEHYFSSKVATDSVFCNRVEEQRLLNQNIETNQHTVIVAPRRYGKTSLVLHTLGKGSLPYAAIDLFCVVYEEDVCKKVAAAVSMLVRQMASFSEKTLKIVEQCFKSIAIGFKAGHIELNVEFGKSAADSITQLEALLSGLENLANKRKQPVVLFFDEFQDVLKIDETNKLQAAIRSVAQHSKYVTYIFSGSSRMMLDKIFDDKGQPLYMLCKKMLLDRISASDFKKHMQKAAKNRWKKEINESILDKILAITECHPYYTNLLCDKLWHSNTPPTLNSIQSAWEIALFENKGKIIADLTPLNTNRTKVLTTTALLNVVNEPNSKLFLDIVKLPLASTQNAVKYLLDRDYLHETSTGLELVDPMMKAFIQKRFKDSTIQAD